MVVSALRAAIKDYEAVVNTLTEAEKVEYASYVTALAQAKAKYNAVVNNTKSDLETATKTADWLVFGLLSSVALAAAAYVLMKRG